MRIALLVLFSLLAAHARAEATPSKLHVSAQVVVSCKLEAGVPKAGSPNRGAGAASFSVACTRGANASVVECAAGCTLPRNDKDHDKLRTESQVTESGGGGPTIATLLF